jgi:glycosyltransferase involved in cell wall biosynthesis
VRKVLIIAFHFPPQAESSGYLRTLKFCRYLPEQGWQPHILSVDPKAYERTSPSQMNEIPPSVQVDRVFALDTRRHLSVGGRYLRSMALPDRWVTWCLGAIPAGYWAVRHRHCDIIYTTFPIASAVLIGWMLHRITGKPWVADFRDSMTEPDYPRDPATWKVHRWLEKRAIREASCLIFTAQSAVRMYLARYPELSPERCRLIFNGFDEADFKSLIPSPSRPNRPLRLVHMGLLYPIERDPLPFFKAISQLQRDGILDRSRVRIELRASGNESQYEPFIRSEGIDNLVHLLPPLPYREGLETCMDADGLLLFQAACCDHQIPAKLFEYLRFDKPILALTSPTGDTASLLRQIGGSTLVDLADWQSIYRMVPDFLNSVESGIHPHPNASLVQRYSRKEQAEKLAQLLNEVFATTGHSAVENI